MYWTHAPVAPWQTPVWLAQARAQLRPSAYLRMIENRFVAGEAGFVPVEWWDACVNPTHPPLLADPTLPVWVGGDASVRRDSPALLALTVDQAAQRVVFVRHRVFQP